MNAFPAKCQYSDPAHIEPKKSWQLFRDFIDTTAYLSITEKDVEARSQKRSHNPLLIAANFEKNGCPYTMAS